MVAMGFSAKDFIIAARPFPDLSTFRVDQGGPSAASYIKTSASRRRTGLRRGGFRGPVHRRHVSARRSSHVRDLHSLEDIPVVGGSAGDGLRFDKSWIFYSGRAHSDAAILILIKTRLPFRLFKCDHFEPTSVKMVVIRSGYRAPHRQGDQCRAGGDRILRAVRIGDTKLDALSFAAHPVLVRVGGSYYARSIQRMDPDGSLRFFCAIDEGMVLTVAQVRNPVDATNELFRQLIDDLGEVSIFIGFECVLRRLAVEQHQLSREMSELYRRNNVIGFQTYGEQYRSMHVNQTLTGVAIGRRRIAP